MGADPYKIIFNYPYGRSFPVKKSYVYAAWGVLYAICVGLGFVPNPEGFGKVLLVLTGLIFFLPPAFLFYRARKEGDIKTVRILRYISLGVLLATLVLLALNFMSVLFSARVGLVVYVLLVMFSAPMVCCQYWVLSLFLWACLLMLTLPRKSRPGQR